MRLPNALGTILWCVILCILWKRNKRTFVTPVSSHYFLHITCTPGKPRLAPLELGPLPSSPGSTYLEWCFSCLHWTSRLPDPLIGSGCDVMTLFRSSKGIEMSGGHLAIAYLYGKPSHVQIGFPGSAIGNVSLGTTRKR